MKAFKITLVLVVLISSLTACTKQDLSEDDVLHAPEIEAVSGEETFR
ncbi:hypothetical protein [Algibacter mikhailovii]|nr:hypothetical protein [Algibacter mikhailovii]